MGLKVSKFYKYNSLKNTTLLNSLKQDPRIQIKNNKSHLHVHFALHITASQIMRAASQGD